MPALGLRAAFRNRESVDPIAAPLVRVLLDIKECFASEYDAAEIRLSYDSESGCYLGKTWPTIRSAWRSISATPCRTTMTAG